MQVENLAKQKDFQRGRKSRNLYYDLEVAPALGWFFGNGYQTNIYHVETYPKVISYSCQWEGEKEIFGKTLADYPGYKPSRFDIDDTKLVKELHEIMEEADVLIGHNSDKFDMLHINTRFLENQLLPLDKKIQIDTLKIARKYFKMPRNNLDEIYRFIYKKPGKTKDRYNDLIWPCLDGDKGAWKKMLKYNKRDVFITREVYRAMRGFHHTHPNLNFFTRGEKTCGNCQKQTLMKDGLRYRKAGIFQRYRCKNCGHPVVGEKVTKDVEPVKQMNP